VFPCVEKIHECKAIKVRCSATEIKPLKTEIKLYLKPQFVPHREHSMLPLQRSIRPMFYGEVMAVYFSSHTKHVNTLCVCVWGGDGKLYRRVRKIAKSDY